MQDQTNPEWLQMVAFRNQATPGDAHYTAILMEREVGTGLFLIPDVVSQVFAATKKVLVPDLTYGECRRRGALTMAFKWVPTFIASYGQLLDTMCGAECEDTCSQQQPGCLCNERRHRCE